MFGRVFGGQVECLGQRAEQKRIQNRAKGRTWAELRVAAKSRRVMMAHRARRNCTETALKM